MTQSLAWLVKPDGRIRVHHRSCPYWAAGLHGRNQWKTIDEVLELMRAGEIQLDQVCSVCGTQPRHVYTEETTPLAERPSRSIPLGELRQPWSGRRR